MTKPWNYIDGRRDTSLYNVYLGMKKRCYNQKHIYFKYYGDRGIKVCDDWLEDYAKFKKWAELAGYKKGLQLDRIDNNGNYIPKNCRFVTPAENCRNRRSTKLDANKVNKIRELYKSKELNQQQIADKFDISHQTVSKVVRLERWRGI